MNSGDLSPLLPLTLRDVIWLRQCREIKQKAENEAEQAKLEISVEAEKQKQLLLMDLRLIMFAHLGFDPAKPADADNFWYSLPSMAANGIKNPAKMVGRSRAMRKNEQKKGD